MANIDDKKIPRGGVETPIVGRLHDVSEDHVVTGANEVFDDAFGERQSQINDKLRHYTKMAHIRIDAEEITREHNDNLLNEEINTKQLEIGAVETDIEPILDSPNMLPSGAVALNLGWYRGNDNPEWVYCITDGATRILAGIKKDGSVEWMIGVPTPIKNYIDAHIQELIERLEEHILEELEEKVDKEEGKSLIDAEYADGVSYIENPEFLDVKTDHNQRLLEGTRANGTKVFGGNVEIKGKVTDTLHVDKISQEDFLTEVIDSPEWKRAFLTEDGRIVFGIRHNCSIDWSVGVPVPIQKAIEKIYENGVLSSFKYVSNSEYLLAVTDNEGHFLFGVTVEGVFRVAKLEFAEGEVETWLDEVYSIIEDIEDRLEITLDVDGRILGYREKDGTRYEEKFKTNHLSLTSTGMTEFQQALKDAGFNPGGHSTEIEDMYPQKLFVPILKNLNKKSKLKEEDGGRGNTDSYVSPLVLLHFSDTHGDKKNLERVRAFYNLYGNYIKDVIHNGDAVFSTFDEKVYGDFKFWSDAGAESFLQCIGNHDCWTDGTHGRGGHFTVGYTEEECYKRFFIGYEGDEWTDETKLRISNPIHQTWEAVMNTNKCYYYKDYNEAKIRLIVTDSEHLTDEQNNWVIGLLDDIIDNDLGLSVIIVSHRYPKYKRISNSFSTLQPVVGSDSNNTLIQAVDSFMQRGGDFVCWMCGHSHRDQFGYVVGSDDTEYTGQTVYAINKTQSDNITEQWPDDWSDTTGRDYDTYFQDCMNLFKVDTYEGYITLYRVGLPYDGHLQNKEILIYDYRNKKVLFN